MEKLFRTRAFSTRPETSCRGLQTQQGTNRRWEQGQRPFHQDHEEDEARHHSHAHQQYIAFLRHRPRELRTMCGSRTGGWSLPCVMSD
jgi:hypothetical protein